MEAAEVVQLDMFPEAASFLARCRSPHTRRAYGARLRAFSGYLRSVGIDWTAVDDRILYEYRDALVGADYAPATVNHHLTVVRQYLHYLWSKEILGRDPGAATPGLLLPVSPESPRAYLAIEEVQALLRAVAADETPRGRRDQAILSLALRRGLRRSEIAALDAEDLGDRGGVPVLRVRCKGGRERILALSQRIVDDVAAWRTVGEIKDGPLFRQILPHTQTVLPARLSPGAIWDVVRRRCRQAGISRRVSPHILRHTLAAHAYRITGGDIERVRRALGHADPRTTARYAHPEDVMTHVGDLMPW